MVEKRSRLTERFMGCFCPSRKQTVILFVDDNYVDTAILELVQPGRKCDVINPFLRFFRVVFLQRTFLSRADRDVGALNEKIFFLFV